MLPGHLELPLLVISQRGGKVFGPKTVQLKWVTYYHKGMIHDDWQLQLQWSNKQQHKSYEALLNWICFSAAQESILLWTGPTWGALVGYRGRTWEPGLHQPVPALIQKVVSFLSSAGRGEGVSAIWTYSQHLCLNLWSCLSEESL